RRRPAAAAHDAGLARQPATDHEPCADLPSGVAPDGVLDLLRELVESALEFLGLALAAKSVVAGGLAGGLLCPSLGLPGPVLDASNNALDPGVPGHGVRPPRVAGF